MNKILKKFLVKVLRYDGVTVTDGYFEEIVEAEKFYTSDGMLYFVNRDAGYEYTVKAFSVHTLHSITPRNHT